MSKLKHQMCSRTVYATSTSA